MSEFPQIFAFYSFKGGVGRSMALLNVAYALAAKGRHVLVLDMDLEAPGVSGFLHREGEIPGFARLDMVDLVGWAKSIPLPLAPGSFPPLSDYAVSVPREKLESIPRVFSDLGRLDIIPVDEERDYYSRLTALALNGSDQNDLVRIGSVLRAWLKSLRFPIEVPDYYGPDFERTAAYDYVLVDSRTGITETGGLCIGPMSDKLVVLTALNDQNVKGTHNFLTEVGILRIPHDSDSWPDSKLGTADSMIRPKPYLIVASLVPYGEIEKKEERLRCLEKEVGKVAIKLSYHPRLALQESIFTRDFRNEYLAGEYEKLLGDILDMAGDGDDGRFPEALLKFSRSSAEFKKTVSQLLRSAPLLGSLSGFLLRTLLSTTNVLEMTNEDDFMLWDRACRILSSGQSPFRFDIANDWANLLTHWSLRSTDPELRELRLQAAMHHYEWLLQEEGASSDQRALALYNRAATYSELGYLERAIDDYDTLIRMPDAPADQKVGALLNRCATYVRRGEAERAINEFDAVIQMPDVPSDQKLQALLGRGWVYLLLGRNDEAIADNELATVLSPNNPIARGNLAISLLAHGELNNALVAYHGALRYATLKNVELMIASLRQASGWRGAISGADEAMARLEARRQLLSLLPTYSHDSHATNIAPGGDESATAARST